MDTRRNVEDMLVGEVRRFGNMAPHSYRFLSPDDMDDAELISFYLEGVAALRRLQVELFVRPEIFCDAEVHICWLRFVYQILDAAPSSRVVSCKRNVS